MMGWVLLGIIGFIIILFVILKILNGKSDVIRVTPNLEGQSLWDKVKKACCTRKK